jgi:hypothetical protein
MASSNIIIVCLVVLLTFIVCYKHGKKMRARFYTMDESSYLYSRSGFDNHTRFEKYKKKLNPELEVHEMHELGDDLYKTLIKKEDPFTLDGLIQKSDETADDRLIRNLQTANTDGPQLEGMTAPIVEFEESALSRQSVKKTTNIYVGQTSMLDADTLSEYNL